MKKLFSQNNSDSAHNFLKQTLREVIKEELSIFRIDFKAEIIKEIDIRFYDVIETILRVNKEYYTQQTERYLGALKEAIADENMGYRDMVIAVAEKTELHENRISSLEFKIT